MFIIHVRIHLILYFFLLILGCSSGFQPKKNRFQILSYFISIFIFPVSAVDGWRKFLEKERQYVHKDGLRYYQKLVDGVENVEKVLIANEHVNTLKLFKILNAEAIQLLPYIQNEKARKIHSEIVEDVKKLINDSDSNKLGPNDMHNFIRKTFKSVSAL